MLMQHCSAERTNAVFSLSTDSGDYSDAAFTWHAVRLLAPAAITHIGRPIRCVIEWLTLQATVISEHTCTVEPLSCGHLGDLVKCPV
jgi:hypothetical protein